MQVVNNIVSYTEERQSFNNHGSHRRSHDHSHHRDGRSRRSRGHRSRHDNTVGEVNKLERKEEEEGHKLERKEEDHRSDRRRNHCRSDLHVHVNNVRDICDHACNLCVRRKKDHTQVRLWQAKASQRI